MAKTMILARFLLVGSAPLSAVQAQAPQASADALYCLWVEPATGSRLESVQCYTRADWADADVDVDRDWAENGVRVIEPGAA